MSARTRYLVDDLNRTHEAFNKFIKNPESAYA